MAPTCTRQPRGRDWRMSEASGGGRQECWRAPMALLHHMEQVKGIAFTRAWSFALEDQCRWLLPMWSTTPVCNGKATSFDPRDHDRVAFGATNMHGICCRWNTMCIQRYQGAWRHKCDQILAPRMADPSDHDAPPHATPRRHPVLPRHLSARRGGARVD